MVIRLRATTPKFLLKQRQGWYAVLEIPKALRNYFGKVRFKQSLETDSLSVANSRVLPVVAEWKKQIAIAKGLEIGSDDELLATLALVRQDAQRHRSKGVPDYEIRMAQEQVAIAEYLGDKNEGGGPTTLYDAISVAHSDDVLLREHNSSIRQPLYAPTVIKSLSMSSSQAPISF